MGLDITAYEKLGDYVGNEEPEDWKNHSHLWPGDFPAQADGLQEGWYHIPEGSDSLGFRAGSYSGYNQFRSVVVYAMSGLCDRDYWSSGDHDNAPLRSWLHFSDCEGVLGPKTCAKLYREACEVADRVRPMLDERDQYIWDKFVAAFKLAADTGCVRFH